MSGAGVVNLTHRRRLDRISAAMDVLEEELLACVRVFEMTSEIAKAAEVRADEMAGAPSQRCVGATALTAAVRHERAASRRPAPSRGCTSTRPPTVRSSP